MAQTDETASLPEWPRRAAPTRPALVIVWSRSEPWRVGEVALVPRERNRVVRHEVLHAQVRSGGFEAPQWFHEGLAQHFAAEHSRAQRRSYKLMVDHRTYVPFPSLEGSFLVISQGRDARLAYHQSLAMIELLVARRGQGAIGAGIDFLRGGGDATLLWDHMAGPSGLDGDDLLAFVEDALGER